MWRWVLACVVMLAAAPALAANEPIPLSAFFSKREITGAALSPSGRYIAFLRKDPDSVSVDVMDHEDGAVKQAFALKGSEFGLNWAYWKDEDHVLLGVTVLKLYRAGKDPTSTIERFKYGRFMIVATQTGQRPVVLFRDDQRSSMKTEDYVSLLDLMESDPQHVLAVAPQSVTGYPAAWKVDIATGAADIVEKGDEQTTGWVTDSAGNLVIRYRDYLNTLEIQGRAPGAKDWSSIRKVRHQDERELGEFEVMGSGERTGTVYVAVKPTTAVEGDTRNLHLFDTATGQLGPPLWPASAYDLNGIVRPTRHGPVMAACHLVDIEVCEFKDKAAGANFAALGKFFDNERNIRAVSFSRDGRWWLLLVSGPDEPGAYYLYDSQKHAAESLIEAHPDLDPDKLGRMERFTYHARDGASIPGYLTIPRGAGSKPPLVVMPHGGPEVRDSFDYDTFGQILASRGYMVLQSNYRGSGGYGTGFANAGFGQSQRRTYEDVLDGVKALVASGRVDPARICIFGASYGGYEALLAGGANPETFKCVVSLAGVSDLVAMMKWERDMSGHGASARFKYWSAVIGDPSQDKARLEQFSPITYAKSYQPPVLLFHGDRDGNVPVDQSKAMERALKAAGKDVRLRVYRGESHSGWAPEHMIEVFTDILAFIDGHIGQQAGAGRPALATASSAAAPAPIGKAPAS